ncbi:VOC family protein [Antrihabitans cavernicola]|uniref:VOC family protein n=1 Tax=Antrihabitans cavernicola TaxID=2495913 RepID=A0A5A7SCH7_9NOCA|nr:VOC family protein [Spelaeibacter cavernicola]KAA0022447.1 VOC family protein [Spelaeibacter cavernicola]
MFGNSKAFSGFAVDDVDAAKKFYGDTLGLGVDDGEMGNVAVQLPNGANILVYPKENHVPATFTILNFTVDNIDEAVDQLAAKGVQTLRYDGFPQDERGVMRGKKNNYGPDIAWFTDPAGNVLAVIEE